MPGPAPLRSIVVGIALLLGFQATTKAQNPPPIPFPPTTLFDPRLEDVRRASIAWDLRVGPKRVVLDQVCLVPDVATYLDAIATWDERSYFPILIDDVEISSRFIQAFRPARIVRYPARGTAVSQDKLWTAAVKAVGLAWTADETPRDGGVAPSKLGALPPGIVLARPESPALPGLVALAAGRFQPLVRLESTKGYAETLNADDLKTFINATNSAIKATIPTIETLGDDCDFVTIAGDYPYRYASPKGALAIDDRIGRSETDQSRWAYNGRLMGDARWSVYAAMCSLFLRPDSALLFNSYPETSVPWSIYTLNDAAARLRPIMPLRSISGERLATIKGWHDEVDPVSRDSLVFLNTKGSPNQFDLMSGPAHAYDIMPSVPAAVALIHSFSAADPTNPATIAGRWLAQGAFVYHGSVDEPFLAAFRTPTLVASLLVDGVPFGAAFRAGPSEPFGQPWKLTFLGDPLYRLSRRAGAADRSSNYGASADWPSYRDAPKPETSASPSERLAWALNSALARLASSSRNNGTDDILAVLQSLPRDTLSPASRTIKDELTFVLLLRSRKIEDARSTLRAIPEAERSAVVTRLAISAMLADFQRALGRRDIERAGLLWNDLIRIDADRSFKAQVTARIAVSADNAPRRAYWQGRLRATLPVVQATEAGDVIKEELKRVEAAVATDRGASKR